MLYYYWGEPDRAPTLGRVYTYVFRKYHIPFKNLRKPCA